MAAADTAAAVAKHQMPVLERVEAVGLAEGTAVVAEMHQVQLQGEPELAVHLQQAEPELAEQAAVRFRVLLQGRQTTYPTQYQYL
jgi:hypothetical protein